MTMLQCEDLSFTFSGESTPLLSDINFSMEAGEFTVLCGKSGSGKTTLLRCIHRLLAPAGTLGGNVFLAQRSMAGLSGREIAESVGYVGQNPENQMVTDTVWHEMAFGLENLGVERETIRLRVGEMAEYFGIGGWFRREVSTLSGGQKQIVNLASVMVMRPKLLLLDEPTSSLDPTGAARFLQMLRQLHEDLGTTVLLSEQRLEEVVPAADTVLLMEEGRVLEKTVPGKCVDVAKNLAVFSSMPVAMRTAWALEEERGETYPVSVREGKAYLREKLKEKEERAGGAGERAESCREENVGDAGEKAGSCREKNVGDAGEKAGACGKEAARGKEAGGDAADRTRASDGSAKQTTSVEEKKTVLHVKDVTVGYEKGVPVMEDLDMRLQKGEMLAIVGGNGAGKSTLLKVMAGIRKPWRGSVRRTGKCCYLPQNPESLFVEISVEEELADAYKVYGKKEVSPLTLEEKRDNVEKMLAFLDLENVRRHIPYDLSGGQMQRLALGKLLLLEPEILLLDEPTKGMDGSFKKRFAKLLKRLQEQGMTIVMVSHDLNFVGEYMEQVAMLFDKSILYRGSVRRFLLGNAFYTTAFCRMCRETVPDVIHIEELVQRVRGGDDD